MFRSVYRQGKITTKIMVNIYITFYVVTNNEKVNYRANIDPQTTDRATTSDNYR